MEEQEIDEFLVKLLKHNRILLCLHENVDADSLCSNIAMSEILVNYRKQVTIIAGKNQNFPKNFNAFGDWMKIVSNQRVEDLDLAEYDCFLMLDTASENRLHDIGESMTLPKFVIDHHSGNRIEGTTASLIDSSRSSTAEMIYEVSENLKKGNTHLFGGDFLLAVYMGIWSDTMGLKYNVSARTFEILAKILSNGRFVNSFDPNPCLMMYEKSWDESDFKMVQLGIENLNLSSSIEGLGICIITQQEIKALQIDEKTDTDALIQVFQKSATLSILVIAQEDNQIHNKWRIRVRSFIEGSHAKDISEKLGGTGHDRSAGAILNNLSRTEAYQEIRKACG